MCCSGTSPWGSRSCFHQHISAWLHSEKQTKIKEWSTNQKTSVQLHWNPALVSRTLCSRRAQQSKEDWRKAASMMNVLEQFPCKEGLSKLMLFSLEIRHAGGSSSLGNSLPKDAINAKVYLNSRADWTSICKADPLESRTLKNNNKLRKSAELKTAENRNTFWGFYKAQEGFLITIKLWKIAVRQTQCSLLMKSLLLF